MTRNALFLRISGLLPPKWSKVAMRSARSRVDHSASSEWGARFMGLGDIVYRDEPTVLVFADTVLGLERCSASVTAVGGRVAAALPIVDALARLDEQAQLDAVLVDCMDDPGDMFDRLLDRLDLAARTGRHASVITVTPDMIDSVAARCSHQHITVLCAPAPVDRIDATGWAIGTRRDDRLHDRGEESPPELRQLSEEVSRIARTLAALSGGQNSHPRDA